MIESMEIDGNKILTYLLIQAVASPSSISDRLDIIGEAETVRFIKIDIFFLSLVY